MMDMTKEDLQYLCEKRNLPKTGNKATLVTRIKERLGQPVSGSNLKQMKDQSSSGGGSAVPVRPAKRAKKNPVKKNKSPAKATPRKSSSGDEAFVYIATDTSGTLTPIFKVGYTTSIRNRLGTFKTGMPNYAIVGVIRLQSLEDAKTLEQQLHGALDRDRIPASRENFQTSLSRIELLLQPNFTRRVDGIWISK